MTLPVLKRPELGFSHTSYFDRSALMILSECRKCGARETVCRLDGSLQRWESQHDCGNMRPFLIKK